MAGATLGVIGVVGAGVMGSGIAQLALEAGHEVVLHDVDEVAIARGRNLIADGLARRAARILDDAADAGGWIGERMARLRETDVLESLGDEADVIVEAALETLELKQTIFRTLDAVAPASTILATNTSALSVTAIASATSRTDRVIGLHFFNPAPVMKLVEVVGGRETAPAVIAAAAALVEAWGRTAVRSADSPGFIVNRVNRPFTLRALRLLERGEATVEEIDTAIRESGFPLGPFELMDLTGIDVTFAASTAIWEALARPDRLRPSPIQETLIAAGRLGRKTGVGFYRYSGGRRMDVASSEPARSHLSADEIRDRILLPIVDEAYRIAGEGVATRPDIDLALRLGAAHPVGPFERAAEAGGAASVADRLRTLVREDPSLAPSDALAAG